MIRCLQHFLIHQGQRCIGEFHQHIDKDLPHAADELTSDLMWMLNRRGENPEPYTIEAEDGTSPPQFSLTGIESVKIEERRQISPTLCCLPQSSEPIQKNTMVDGTESY